MRPESPIFIGGLAHSGKTQVRMIIGAHPAISMTRRTKLWNRYYGRFGDLRDRANLDRALDAMIADERVRQLRPDRDLIRREFLAGPLDYAHLFALFHQHHAQRCGKRRWGDQLGFVEHFAEPIFAAFPEAKMIHMVRDPRARHHRVERASSSRKGKLGWETAMWLHSAELARRNGRACPDNYRVVRYEELAARPHETAAELCDFLGEQYLAPMRAGVETLRFDDVHDRAGAPASAATASFLERYAGRELDALGYVRARPRLSPREQASFLLAEWPLNRAGMAAWRAFAGRRLGRQVRADRPVRAVTGEVTG